MKHKPKDMVHWWVGVDKRRDLIAQLHEKGIHPKNPHNMKLVELERLLEQGEGGKYMELNEYQEKSKRTIPDKNIRNLTANFCMGLSGETGELTDHFKKYLFHGHDLDMNNVKKELGDILFYAAGLATIHGLELGDIAQTNIEKLERRYPNGFSEEDSVNRDE